LREDPATANITDRLSSTLFVAALFHGIVILGITFTASPLGDDDELPTLRITLIADGPDSEDPSQDADFLAQRSQIGSAELASGDRPTTTLAADSPISRQGDPGGVDPTLEVAIDADGRLVDIVIRQFSGSASLDQAALTILRMVAPFEALPAAVRAEYDVLRFAYEWDFDGG
jgi:TonB family protein